MKYRIMHAISDKAQGDKPKVKYLKYYFCNHSK